MWDELTEQVETLIMPCIQELSAELVELNLKKRGKTVVVGIIADKPHGGITVGECTLINKKVVRAIGKRRGFDGDYVVEVSSPGLVRALKTSKDFSRVLGRKVRVHLLESVGGKREHLGEVAGVQENQILITEGNEPVAIPLEHIAKAVQVIEE